MTEALSPVHTERMARFAKCGVYLVTGQELSAGRSTPEIVKAALRGGVRLIQLREKDMPLRELHALAEELRALTLDYEALMIVNDRVDLALAVGADGVHLGQADLPVAAARSLSPDLIIGHSTHSEAEAAEARALGSSYLNIGPIYPTQTKDWDDAFLGLEGLRRIAPHADIPFTVMGGIKRHHVDELCAAGARTVAVVTEITAAEDPEAAARELVAAMAAGRGD